MCTHTGRRAHTHTQVSGLCPTFPQNKFREKSIAVQELQYSQYPMSSSAPGRGSLRTSV